MSRWSLDLPRKLGPHLVGGALVGALQGVVVVVFAHDVPSALLFVLASTVLGIGLVVATIPRRRTSTAADSPGAVTWPLTASVSTGLITYVAWRSISATVVIYGAALVANILMTFVGSRIMKRPPSGKSDSD
jgi:hypothetical protein